MTISARLQAAQMPKFRRGLLAWYGANRRDLPWRKTRDPYRIWVSEIMLQQTRVAAVLMHYEKFLRRFPTVRKLAAAPEASVLAEWSGLGYYRRARNMHSAAKLIAREHGGKFPRSSEQWRQLPGIGRYTAAAISSIAFHEPVGVLDGNVERVLRRLLGRVQTQTELWSLAERLLDRDHPGDFNQAMMELGALVCLPAEPRCCACPVARFCRTRGRGRLRAQKQRQRKRTIFFALARRSDSILLVQRASQENLMAGMWELPEVRANSSARKPLFSLRHAITVTDFTVHVVDEAAADACGEWVRIARINALPLTGLARKILRRAEIIK
jgi:A/G-specific adenine glycosylase